MTIKAKKLATKAVNNNQENNNQEKYAHNREKKYILQEGKPVEFLVGLGVQSKEGIIAKNRYDKFRQINRYLEYIEDVLDTLPVDRPIRIIDFGCGKSYLTFALYYYLKVLQNRDLEVLGLDLKKDVIEHCNRLAQEYGYDKLHFQVGDISSFEGWTEVDMVVSLHACDTATDYALEKAVKWGAKVIMAVPCCQHEVNKQIKCEELEPVLQYGIIKERISALLTDAIRADILTQQGYDTQILEFIDMEHTPKNLLIRAVKQEGGAGKMKKKNSAKNYSEEEMRAIIKIVIWMATFCLALFISGKVVNKENVNLTTDLDMATLPLITMEKAGIVYNNLYGYLADMDVSYQQESITELGDNRDISFEISTYGDRVDTVNLEVRSLDGERLIENKEVEDFETTAGKISIHTSLKDLIEKDTLYSLTILLKDGQGRQIRYYTHIIWSDKTNAVKKMEFVKDFHEKTA